MVRERWEPGELSERDPVAVADLPGIDPWQEDEPSGWDPERLWEAGPKPIFFVLSTLTERGRQRVGTHPARILEVNHEVEQAGCRVLAQYALLGKYDFATIVEAPDSGTMERVAIEITARGSIVTLSMPALPAEDYVAAMKQMDREEML